MVKMKCGGSVACSEKRKRQDTKRYESNKMREKSRTFQMRRENKERRKNG